MKYNYHMHSCYSDATNTPEQLIELAVEHGVQSVALTDHDTIDGMEAFMASAAGTDIKAITGVEISSRIGQKYVHILGYGIDTKNTELVELLDDLSAEATAYTKHVFEGYVTQNYDYSWEQVLIHNQGRKAFYLSSLYDAMLKDGLFSDWGAYNAFVAHCFRFEKQCYGATVEKSFEVIKNCGGKAYLAHPKLMKLSLDEEYLIFKQMKDLGLDGIEAYYPEHSPRESNWYELCCERLDLKVSGGTDWHGWARPKSPLYFFGDIRIEL